MTEEETDSGTRQGRMEEPECETGGGGVGGNDGTVQKKKKRRDEWGGGTER